MIIRVSSPAVLGDAMIPANVKISNRINDSGHASLERWVRLARIHFLSFTNEICQFLDSVDLENVVVNGDSKCLFNLNC